MKLSLLTYQLGKDFALEGLLELCAATGCKGLECRAQLGHAHGIELETDTAARTAIRKTIDASPVRLVGISTSCRFEFAEPDKVREQVDIAKQFIDLAADVGAPQIRVFGNAFPKDSDKDDVITTVGESIREIGEYAAPRGVDCNLEMHGDFYYWEYALRAVEIADHPRVGIVYNCDPRETRWGPIGTFLDPIAPFLRHIHMHNLEEDKYPYAELFRILKNLGYAGYLSLECSPSPDPKRVIALYAKLFEWMYWNV